MFARNAQLVPEKLVGHRFPAILLGHITFTDFIAATRHGLRRPSFAYERRSEHAPGDGRRHPAWLSRALTFAAGITHGLFASGGPLLVYALAGTRLDKGGLRATLVTVWFSLNAGLTVAFLVDGTLVPALPKVAAYLPVLGTGYLLGEFLHHRLDERRFRQLVYVMLIATGAALVIR
ncbi:MAG: sulfite exporter TauE/SafE family protein [Pseudomonadota bacterium]|nr:MAG: sulfite exporter TauE/SafE family protein [Pseudomonadota bacterium]